MYVLSLLLHLSLICCCRSWCLCSCVVLLFALGELLNVFCFLFLVVMAVDLLCVRSSNAAACFGQVRVCALVWLIVCLYD